MAFLSTCVIFVCLTLASLLSEKRSFLFLAGKIKCFFYPFSTHFRSTHVRTEFVDNDKFVLSFIWYVIWIPSKIIVIENTTIILDYY